MNSLKLFFQNLRGCPFCPEQKAQLHPCMEMIILVGAGAKLKQEKDSKESSGKETEARIQKLIKEKDEMLELVMQRGKLIQVRRVV